jgi:hypothetical protein
MQSSELQDSFLPGAAGGWGPMSEWPNYKRLRIDSLIHMSDEATPPPAPPCIDDLMDSACDCLDLCCDRGLKIGPETKMIEKATEERNSSRLQNLIARVEAKIRNMMPPASVPLRRLRYLRRLRPRLLQNRNSKTTFKLIMLI